MTQHVGRYLSLAVPAVQGVLKGMGAREKQLLTAETLEADLEQRKKLLAEAEAGGGNKLGSKRVNDLKFEISQLELSITAAKNEYEKIKAANVQVGSGWVLRVLPSVAATGCCLAQLY